MGAEKIDFDSNSQARKNLISIIAEGSRLLYPHEVAWFLSMGISQVYAKVPRVKTLDSSIRFDAAVVRSLKMGGQFPLVSSMTIEKNGKSVDLPKPPKRRRKEKVELCL